MSWKNLTQYGLADALLSKHDSLKELDDVLSLAKGRRTVVSPHTIPDSG